MIRALAVAAGIVLAATFAGCGEPAPRTQATIEIRRSHFEPGKVTVLAGVPVTFTLQNDDPIEHEWIVGDAATHERHRTGTEPQHDAVPGEITVRAYSTKTTTVTFEKAGDYLYICHLPGHEEYGMRGVVHVVAE